jgi:hypothetical protein
MRSLLLVAAVALLAAAPPAARPFKTEYKSEAAEFAYGWPAEVSVVPQLVGHFRADMRKQRAAIISGGKEFAAWRKKEGLTVVVPYQHQTSITTAGQSRRLLSLRIDTWEFTGGAHGNGGTDELLWDRSTGKEIEFQSLFAPAARWLLPLRASYCRALEEERRSRRGGDGKLGGSIPEFDACPRFSDLAVIPTDDDHDGRFERLDLVASPYVAGPYVEGEYDIGISVSAQLIAAMKSEYRPSFEVQPQ